MIQIKLIEGYSGLYEITSDGRVISTRFNKRKILRTGIMTSGYATVNLKKEGKQRSWSLHRLLAIHFIDNPDNKKEVNHIDGNKLNNNLANLEWVTRDENVQHAYDTGLKTYRPLHYIGKFGVEHNRSKSIICSNGKIYGSISEASRDLDVSIGTISKAIKESRIIRKGLTFNFN